MHILEQEILELLNQKMEHYSIFRRVTDLRKKQGQSAQFKTEKWLQTEIMVHLWKKGYRVISEYGTERWDLCVLPDANHVYSILLALDCLSDSAQSARSDYENVAEDLTKIVNLEQSQGKGYVVLTLPMSETSSRRRNYYRLMKELIGQHPFAKRLETREYRIPYDVQSAEGIILVWIETK